MVKSASSTPIPAAKEKSESPVRCGREIDAETPSSTSSCKADEGGIFSTSDDRIKGSKHDKSKQEENCRGPEDDQVTTRFKTPVPSNLHDDAECCTDIKEAGSSTADSHAPEEELLNNEQPLSEEELKERKKEKRRKKRERKERIKNERIKVQRRMVAEAVVDLVENGVITNEHEELSIDALNEIAKRCPGFKSDNWSTQNLSFMVAYAFKKKHLSGPYSPFRTAKAFGNKSIVSLVS